MRPAQIQHVPAMARVLPVRLLAEEILTLKSKIPARRTRRRLRIRPFPIQRPHPNDPILSRGGEVLPRVAKFHRPHRVLVRVQGLHQPKLGELLVHLPVHVHLRRCPRRRSLPRRSRGLRGGANRARGWVLVRVFRVPRTVRAGRLRRGRRQTRPRLCHAFVKPSRRITPEWFFRPRRRAGRPVHRRLRRRRGCRGALADAIRGYVVETRSFQRALAEGYLAHQRGDAHGLFELAHGEIATRL